MVIPAAVGALLVLFGIALLIVDLGATNHGVPAAVGVVTLLAGGSALGGVGIFARPKGESGPHQQGGDDRRGWHRRSPVGAKSAGWVFVHGERWRAVLAFAPEGADPREGERMIGMGSKVTVVGFGQGSTVQVVPAQKAHDHGSVDSKD
jgi:membrane-bound ClpP family serine protease